MQKECQISVNFKLTAARPAEKQIIRSYDLLMCVSYEIYDSRIISNYDVTVSSCASTFALFFHDLIFMFHRHIQPERAKGIVKELADNFNKRTMNAM